jgi:hypothetical protein
MQPGTQIFLRLIGGAAIIVVSFFATLALIDYAAPPCPPQGELITLSRPFQKFGNGVAYSSPVPALDSLADAPTAPEQSRYLVCEGSYALGPAHAVHAEIAAKGKGRFSHWKGIGFVFSASDNSDPNTNGRNYAAVARPR